MPEKTIVLSRCLTLDVLERGKVTTSSQKFERDFVRAYADLCDVLVVKIGKTIPEKRVSESKTLSFRAQGRKDTVRLIAGLSRKFSIRLFFTGYDPQFAALALLFKRRGVRSFAFIYDTHKQAMLLRNRFRASLIDIYYSLGFAMTKKLDGWIVLNDQFILQQKITTACRKIKIGVWEHGEIIHAQKPPRERQVFLFSGTLNEENGIRLIVEALRTVRRSDFEFHIYGYGPLAGLVEEACQRDDRIVFFGRTENSTVVERQGEADYLVHLRDPAAASADYSYPSKLIEYISSGATVMTNMYSAIEDVRQFVFSIGDYGSASLAQAMCDALDGKVTVVTEPAVRARFFAERNWNIIVAEIEDFVTGKPRAH